MQSEASDEATEEDTWEESNLITYKILQNKRFRGITEGSTHYHATFLDPWLLQYTGY
jgi:hypothetical protein